MDFNKTILPLIQGTFNQSDNYVSFQNQIIKLVYMGDDGEKIGTLSPIFFPLPATTKTYHGANLVFVEPSDLVMQVKKLFFF
jgi:hypothetical protein